MYLKHVYIVTFAEKCLGDALLGEDRTIPIVEDKVDNAIRRFQWLSATTKASVGQTSRGGSSECNSGGARRRGGIEYKGGRHAFGRQREYDYAYRPNTLPSFGRYNGGALGTFGGNGGHYERWTL